MASAEEAGLFSRRYLWVWILVVVGAASVGWWWLNLDPEGGEPQALCSLIIDQTALGDEDLRRDFEAAVQETAGGCATREAELAIYTMDPTGTEFDWEGDFPLYPEQAITDRIRQESIDSRRQAAQQELSALLDPTGESARADGSNILRAMSEAAQRMRDAAQSEDLDSTFLVVLTRGLQVSSAISVQPLTDGGTPESLARQTVEGAYLPDLQGINVSMVGVGAGLTAEGEPLSEEFREALTDYWSAVIVESGGRLCHVVSTTPRQLPGGDC